MVSIDHVNAEMYFARDVDCIKRFFARRFHFPSDEPGPFFVDACARARRRRCPRLDVEVEASGFSRKMARELDKYMDDVGRDGTGDAENDAEAQNDEDPEDDEKVEDDREVGDNGNTEDNERVGGLGNGHEGSEMGRSEGGADSIERSGRPTADKVVQDELVAQLASGTSSSSDGTDASTGLQPPRPLQPNLSALVDRLSVTSL